MSNHSFIGYFSTQTKMFVRHWQSLYDLMLRDEAASLIDGEAESNPELLNDVTLSNALNGTFAGFFRASLQEYLTISKKRFASHVEGDDGLKPTTDLNKRLGLSDDQVTNTSDAKLAKHQRALSSLIDEHHDQWVELLHKSSEDLVSTLKSNDIPIVDSEIAELSFIDSRSKLWERLTGLKLECFAKDAILSIKEYLHYKALVAMNNAYYRTQQVAEIEELPKHLTKIKNLLLEVETSEKVLLETQQKALKKLASGHA